MVSEPSAPGTQTLKLFKFLKLFDLKATQKKWPVIFVECMYELVRQHNWKLASAYFEIITNNRERHVVKLELMELLHVAHQITLSVSPLR